MDADDGNKLRVEVREEIVLRLLEAGCVCAAELDCLDGESEHCLRALCLRSCICKLAGGEGSGNKHTCLYREKCRFNRKTIRLSSGTESSRPIARGSAVRRET